MRAAVMFAVLALAACQTPCPAPETGPVSTSFRCEDGSLLNVTFTRNPDTAQVAQEGYTAVDLPSRVTGSGQVRRQRRRAARTRHGGALDPPRRGGDGVR